MNRQIANEVAASSTRCSFLTTSFFPCGRSWRQRRPCHRLTHLVVVLLAAALATTPLAATIETGVVGGVGYRVMTPDWAPQGEVVSILIVLTADGTEDATVSAELTTPSEFKGEALTLKRRQQVRVANGEATRLAFASLRADAELAPASYEFSLHLASGGESSILTIPVTTIRGAAVARGIWSILVPAAMALLALPAFALFLKRYAAVGSWRRPHDPQLPSAEESWWSQTK